MGFFCQGQIYTRILTYTTTMYFYAYFILYLHLDENIQFCRHKAELLLLKLIHLFAREVLLLKKLEIKETKTT